jgi:hypothetical protein
MARTDVAACRARQEEAALYFLEIKNNFKKKEGEERGLFWWRE